MTEHAKRILQLKGVEEEESESEPIQVVDSERVLSVYHKKKLDAVERELELMQLEKKALQLIIKRLEKVL